MTTEQTTRPRDAGSAPPVGSTAAVVIAVIAVVAGFLILRSIRSDDTTAAPAVTTTTLATVESVVSTMAPVTTPTTLPQVFDGATVVVANSSNVNGAAGRLTLALEGKGFTVGTALNATGADDNLTVSKIYYDPANPNAQAVATTVAGFMGGIVVVEVPSPVPVEGGALPEGVAVLVMLGADKASQTLDEMGGPTTTAGPTTTGMATTTPPNG